MCRANIAIQKLSGGMGLGLRYAELFSLLPSVIIP